MDLALNLSFFIYLRVAGFIFLNDITGRKSIPSTVKLGLSFALMVCFVSIYSYTPPQADNLYSFIFIGIGEILIGFILGFIINLVLSVFVIGGELIDFHIGLSIAKVYDAQTNISMPISGSIINVLFFIFFFFINGHLTLISLLHTSFELIPAGSLNINPDIFYNICLMFSQILLLALKVAQVIIAIMLIVEIGIAIIMKAIPQINIFTINIQFKILLGLILLFLLMPLIANFMESIVTFLFDNLYLAINKMATG